MSKTSPSNIDVHIGRKLKIDRIKAGKSLQEIANVLDVSFQQIQKYEKGMNKVSSSNLYLLAKYLKVEPNHFFEGLEKEYKPEGLEHPFELHEESDEFEYMQNVSDHELLSLARAFFKITNSAVRKKVLDLIRVL